MFAQQTSLSLERGKRECAGRMADHMDTPMFMIQRVDEDEAARKLRDADEARLRDEAAERATAQQYRGSFPGMGTAAAAHDAAADADDAAVEAGNQAFRCLIGGDAGVKFKMLRKGGRGRPETAQVIIPAGSALSTNLGKAVGEERLEQKRLKEATLDAYEAILTDESAGHGPARIQRIDNASVAVRKRNKNTGGPSLELKGALFDDI